MEVDTNIASPVAAMAQPARRTHDGARKIEVISVPRKSRIEKMAALAENLEQPRD